MLAPVYNPIGNYEPKSGNHYRQQTYTSGIFGNNVGLHACPIHNYSILDHLIKIRQIIGPDAEVAGFNLYTSTHLEIYESILIPPGL